MDNIRIVGGKPLKGTVKISGAKNAALPILCASILADGEHVFRNVPALRDIETTCALLEHLGLRCEVTPPIVKVHTLPSKVREVLYELVK